MAEGVDTVADIFVNGHWAARTENSHRHDPARQPALHVVCTGQAPMLLQLYDEETCKEWPAKSARYFMMSARCASGQGAARAGQDIPGARQQHAHISHQPGSGGGAAARGGVPLPSALSVRAPWGSKALHLLHMEGWHMILLHYWHSLCPQGFAHALLQC